MDDDPLDSCMRKVLRARRHLITLQYLIQRFADDKPHQLVRKDHAEGGGRWSFVFRLEDVKQIPPDWSILSGEITYNLHSALDHIARQLALQADGNPPNVTFPIFKNKTRFWRTNSHGEYRQGSGGWALDHFPESARQLVLDVQPYQAGNTAPLHPLWLLYDLSNTDKHESPHIARAAVVKHRLEGLRTKDVEVLSFDVRDEPFDGPTEIGRLRVQQTASYSEFEAEPGFLIQPAFAKGGPASGLEVFETLKAILNYVVIDVLHERFVPYFAGEA